MTLRKQAISLAVMHGVDALQPLLVLPYAARILGPHQFGKFAYAVSIGQFAVTFVGYGFHWTAQRSVSSIRRDPAAVSSLFADVVAAQVVLLISVLIVGLAVSDSVFGLSRSLFLCVMLTAAGVVLFPAWLFIGLELAWKAATAVAVARCLALVCFLTMVRSASQVELAVAIQSAVPLISAFVALPFILQIGFGGFRGITFDRIKLQFIRGWRGFLYTLVERALIALPVPLVEHFSGYAAAGQYSIAEKFVTATRTFYRVITETLLPRVAYYARHNPQAGIYLIQRSLTTLFLGAALSISLFFIAPYIIVLVFGPTYAPAIPIVRVMAIIPLLLNANICMSNLYMFNYGHERVWAHLSVAGLLVFFGTAYLLAPYLANAAIAVAIGVAAKEGVVLIVSVGFFLNCEIGRGRRVAAARVNVIAAGAGHVGSAPAVAFRSDQLRTEP